MGVIANYLRFFQTHNSYLRGFAGTASLRAGRKKMMKKRSFFFICFVSLKFQVYHMKKSLSAILALAAAVAVMSCEKDVTGTGSHNKVGATRDDENQVETPIFDADDVGCSGDQVFVGANITIRANSDYWLPSDVRTGSGYTTKY
jgi:hypothetical protein